MECPEDDARYHTGNPQQAKAQQNPLEVRNGRDTSRTDGATTARFAGFRRLLLSRGIS